MRGLVAVLVISGLLSLGCAGLGEAFDQSFKEGFHQSFMDSCLAEADPSVDAALHQQLCACAAADLESRSASEIMEAVADEAEIERIVQKCAADLLPGALGE